MYVAPVLSDGRGLKPDTPAAPETPPAVAPVLSDGRGLKLRDRVVDQPAEQ